MCSICGFITTQPTPELHDAFLRTFARSAERGRDSHGMVGGPHPDASWGHPFALRRPGPSTGIDETYSLGPAPTWVIANCRAEPTTEYVAAKTDDLIPPFVTPAGTAVTHNGTIANDKELAAALNLPPLPIDSMVIGPLIDRYGIHNALAQLVGSYALAVHAPDGTLYLACNYKPIFIKRLPNAYIFGSLEAHLREDWLDNIVQLPPYSLTTVAPDLTLSTQTLRPPIPARRALVICSGGLDSAVVATHYVRLGYDTTLLHFTYGCRAETREREAVNALAAHLQCAARFIDMRTLFRADIGHSRLTDTAADLMTERGGERSAELAYEWVPARNLIFSSVALAYAEAHGFSTIALGNNLEESGAYPDNEMIFTLKFADLVPNAVNLNAQIAIEQPVGNLTKHEIVRLGLELDAPLHLTWSCYENGPTHCGTCGSCHLRRHAFAHNHTPDPVPYREAS